MMDKFTQFINDKFQYNQSIAMEILVQSGLKEQLFELAKVNSSLSRVIGPNCNDSLESLTCLQ